MWNWPENVMTHKWGEFSEDLPVRHHQLQVNKWQNEQLEKWIPEIQVVHRVRLNAGGLVHTEENTKCYQQIMKDCGFRKSGDGSRPCKLSDS